MPTSVTAAIYAVGDTAPYVQPPGSIFARVSSEMAVADWRFAQVERTFSSRGEYDPQSFGAGSRVDPALASAYVDGGFDVVSLAGNHALDYGPEALVDSITTFRDLDIATVGVGRTSDEAREPAILTKNGLRVGVLAYCSILLPGYEATENSVGCAPLRATTQYRQLDYYPGSPPAIETSAVGEDIDRLQADVAALKERVDFVVMSVHWGVHFVPGLVTDYQRRYAKAAMDAGCDAIMGHGPHLIQAVEMFGDRPCLYSLGNFVMSSMPDRDYRIAPGGERTFAEHYSVPIGPGRDFGHMDHQGVGLMAVLTFTIEDGDRRITAALRPSTTVPNPSAVLLSAHDERWIDTYRFLRWNCAQIGTEKHLVPYGDLITVR